MRITFTFTADPNYTKDTYHKYTSTLVLPDAAKEVSEVKIKVMAIAELVAVLSNVYVFVSCKEIGITKQLARETAFDPSPNWYHETSLLLAFLDFSSGRKRNIKFSILSFQRALLSPPQMGNKVVPLSILNSSTDKGAPIVKELIRRILELGRGKSLGKIWDFNGYFSRYSDTSLFRQKKLVLKKKQQKEREQQKQQEKQQKSLEREEARRQKREELVKARQLNPDAEPKTGAGRTVGARPGMFEGVMMRSQLEVRFAAELKERNIRWIYEGETLGAGGYLVDFYLPDLGVWVEVKGKFEARDRQLLPEVAVLLKERKQSLFVYTSSTCYKVNPSGLRDIPRGKFWGEVVGG